MSVELIHTPLTHPEGLPSAAQLTDEGLKDVEDLMIRLSTGDRLDRCGAMVVEHLSTGGKRLRAQLALAACRLLNVDRASAVAWAAACELLHNASLIHDDVQDGDRMRRGMPTTWARHGVAQAINAGDLLLMLPGLAVDHVPADDAVRYRLSRALSFYAARTVRGQSSEMALLSLGRLSWSDYEHAARGKTAALFALPVYGAALLAGRSEADARAVAGEFERLGFVFQIQDDVLDVFGNANNRPLGSDVREGKITALVVEHLAQYPEDRSWLCGILACSREMTTDTDVQQVRRRFQFAGALDEVLERIYRLASATFESPILAAEPGLNETARILLQRMLQPIRHLDSSLPTGDVL
ncbi:MAG: geranylgeranyl diphosphate synthase type I [Myxococcota bacterium]|jgi:geranylgeranyl diphosphate synthase type I